MEDTAIALLRGTYDSAGAGVAHVEGRAEGHTRVIAALKEHPSTLQTAELIVVRQDVVPPTARAWR